MADRIVVINPNSTEAVTAAMDRALEPLRIEGGPEIVSVTNPAGPPGIECQAHVDDVSRDVRGIVRAHDNDAAAFVIACFSDPGIHTDGSPGTNCHWDTAASDGGSSSPFRPSTVSSAPALATDSMRLAE